MVGGGCVTRVGGSGWWVVGGWVGTHTTRGRTYGSGSDCHVAHMTRVNLSLVEVKFRKVTCFVAQTSKRDVS